VKKEIRPLFIIFLMLTLILVISCKSQSPEIASPEKITSENTVNPAQKSSETAQQSLPQLGDLCTGQEECVTLCHDNKGRCTQYCEEHPENELCGVVFPFKINVAPSSLCQGTNIIFDHAPVNLEETELLLPLGLMTGGHVTPVDHHYFQNFANLKDDIEVYSPGDGVITEIQHMGGAPPGKDYRIVIQHTCTISSIFIHIQVLAEKLAAQAPEDYSGVKIPVKAGEIIGWYKNNVDYNVVDSELTLPGFIIPLHYDGEPWKIHVPNTYDYYNEPVKSKLLAKSVRTIEPRAGKIDYDIDGRLVGNWFAEVVGSWFAEGNDGYSGDGSKGSEYYKAHLSFAYDFMDPSLIIVSIGDYDGKPVQYAVKGNAPDPAKIDIRSGIVKYELVSWGYTTDTGEEWDKTKLAKVVKATAGTHIDGVVLVQILEDRKIKFETFPGKTAGQVNGFTEKARIYGR